MTVAFGLLTTGTIASTAAIAGLVVAIGGLAAFAIYKMQLKEYNDELARFDTLSDKVSLGYAAIGRTHRSSYAAAIRTISRSAYRRDGEPCDEARNA